jgi:intracellular sulfur oxidation DsrE/DsrF family protein
MTQRREFLAQLGGLVAAGSLDASRLDAMTPAQTPDWDLSWVDRITAAKNRVVYNVNAIADGDAVYSAAVVIDQFHDVYGASAQATCAVLVFRAAGTPLGFNDLIWEKYKVGEEEKIIDPATKVSATRNIFLKAREGASPMAAASSISALQQRGLVCVVCNRATKGWASTIAEKTQQKESDVYAELRANLIPGAYLAPSGIFALVRAQNAGCAYLPGD